LVADQDVQVVVLGGNTFGIGACHEIGMVLKTKEKLKACPPPLFFPIPRQALN
jgi:Ran GTPase-activating protein (RanGAP) involved in mRNA processing and transport